MADNVTLNSGTGGAVMATDDVTGVHYQIVKISTGALDAAGSPVSDSNPMPVDDAGGSLTVDNGGTFAVQVDAALPAGANAIGKLAANSGVDIGDVDVTSVVPGTGASNLGKAEDAAHVTGDVGVMALAVRNDVIESLSGTDGDYSPLQVNAEGALYTTGGSDVFAFQTTATLTNGSSYDSGILELSPKYSQVHTTVVADQDGQITITWYTDAGGTDLVRTLVIPYTTASGFQLFAAPAFTPYVKYVFLNNSGSNQTDFHFDTKFLMRPISPQILRVDGPVAGGMVATVSRSLITASNGSDYVNIAATANGNLKMSIQEISDGLDIGAGNAGTETQRVSIATDDVNLAAIKSAIEIIDDWDETNRAAVNVISGQAGITAGAGAVGASTPRVTLASDDPGVALLGTIDADTSALAGAVSGTEMQVDVVGALPTGSNTIGVVDLGATDNAVLDAIEANTGGSTSHYRNIDANAEAAIKGSAGTLKWLHAMNMTAAVAYVHLYDATTANVTPGTTTPDYTFPLATQGDTNGAGFVLPAPIEFANAITVVVTTTLDGSTGDPGTNGVILNAGYV